MTPTDWPRFPSVESYFAWVATFPFFERVGMADRTWQSVRTWREANEGVESDAYICAIVAAANELGERVQAISWAHYDRRWNVHARSIADTENAVLREHIVPQLPTEASARLPRSIIHQIGMGAMELMYADIVRFEWFTGLVDILATGHVACGYEGEYPNGRLIVF